MKKIFLSSVLTLVVFVTLSAEAGREDRRQRHQGARIREGVKSGELTPKEAAGLRRQQGHIRRMEKRAGADGTVTGVEAQRIENAQDRASKNIHDQKHDEQKQGE